MTQQDYTHIHILVDRSGSMSTIKSDTEGGVNTFIEEQKNLPGKTTVTLSVFDTYFDTIHDHVDIAEVQPFVLVPRGGTALYDAMGKSIAETGEWLASLPEEERPGKVTFVTVTDGHENSSHEFTSDTVAALVTEQTNTYAWEFSYLGANQDAILVAKQLGIDPGFALNYAGEHVKGAFGAASASVSRSRMGGSREYTEAERSAVV